MRIIVQKFGGTSVATEAGRLSAVKHVYRALAEGFHVVVVVSAMGRLGDAYATDTLLASVDHKDVASPRDLDLLMACGETISAVTFSTLLRSHGHPVTVLNGQQAGIVTNDHFGDARIIEVQPERVQESLRQGHIVVVTGFQGATMDGDITTLGRGGSDTTACALGAALHAESVDIFTDVDGVMTADPRVVDNARFLDQISYSDICALAYHGAKVIHPYAVETAKAKRVPIHVRNTESLHIGTRITDDVARSNDVASHDVRIVGTSGRKRVWHIEFESDSDATAGMNLMRSSFSEKEVEQTSARTCLFMPFNDNEEEAHRLLMSLREQIKSAQPYAQVAVIHAPHHQHAQSLSELQSIGTKALRDGTIESTLCGGSNQSVWWLVQTTHMSDAIRCLHDAFALGLMQERVAIGS